MHKKMDNEDEISIGYQPEELRDDDLWNFQTLFWWCTKTSPQQKYKQKKEGGIREDLRLFLLIPLWILENKRMKRLNR